MPGFRALVTRTAFLPAFVVYFFLVSNGVPSFHSCFSLADGELSWERLGASAPHGERNHAPASREDGDGNNGFDEEGACVACLLGARPKCLLTPAGVSAPATARVQRIPGEVISIPAPADFWSQILPRAPPANAPS
jgi:hypothetical protein